MSNINIRTLGNFLAALAIDYRENYKGLAKEKETKLGAIKENCIPGSAEYKSRTEEAEATFLEKVTEARKYATKVGSERIEELREFEKTRLTKVNETKLAKLRAIQDMPLTADEIIAFAEYYGANEDYWTSRLLTEIAQKNGLDGFEGVMESNYSTKLSIINDLASQLFEIVREYPAQDKQEQLKLERIYLTEPVLERAYLMYEGRIAVRNDGSEADRAWSALLSKSTDIERGVFLANLLRNAKGEKREEILAKCKEQVGKTFGSGVIALSGYEEEINAFDVNSYNYAKAVVADVVAMNDEASRKERVLINADNKFLPTLLQRASEKRKDDGLQDLALLLINEG